MFNQHIFEISGQIKNEKVRNEILMQKELFEI